MTPRERELVDAARLYRRAMTSKRNYPLEDLQRIRFRLDKALMAYDGSDSAEAIRAAHEARVLGCDDGGRMAAASMGVDVS